MFPVSMKYNLATQQAIKYWGEICTTNQNKRLPSQRHKYTHQEHAFLLEMLGSKQIVLLNSSLILRLPCLVECVLNPIPYVLGT